jgi:hypothetical protein
MVVKLHARRLPLAVAQSASEAQRSWHVLLLLPGMQRFGGVQWPSFRHERQDPAAVSQ